MVMSVEAGGQDGHQGKLKRRNVPLMVGSSLCGSPGLRAKLSMRLFQAMKAIFLMLGEELRKPSSSRCSRELMKGPPRCSCCGRNHVSMHRVWKKPCWVPSVSPPSEKWYNIQCWMDVVVFIFKCPYLPQDFDE